MGRDGVSISKGTNRIRFSGIYQGILDTILNTTKGTVPGSSRVWDS